MNVLNKIRTGYSVCPHDCPSTCALEVDLLSPHAIGRVRGAKSNTYTDGIICEKVARYAERLHHPDRLRHPLKRTGPKGSGQWQPISWEDALGETAEAFLTAERRYGPEAVWPYFYAGTMGLVMRDGINRLRHAKKYSGMYETFCVALSWPGYIAGTGKLAGVDPREMARSDCVVIWGTNAVHTQVNVMHHAVRARKERGAKIVVVDIYNTATMKQADLGIIIRPGTDGALACAIMHVLFRDGYADWPFLEKYTDVPRELDHHLKERTPQWAEAITGCPAAEIENFAALIGQTKRVYFRLGYGFSRHRNGTVNMHAVTSIPAVLGAWKYEGGGALHSNSGIYHWNTAMIKGTDVQDPTVRILDMARIGEVLNGNPVDLAGGPPVAAMLIQNTNPASVAPDQTMVKKGLAREDLFVCVHEQFMTETAQLADVVIPATMFLEHDDIYQGGGHQHIMFGGKLVEPPDECRSNHDVVCDLARRVDARHPGFGMSVRQLIDWTLQNSGWPSLEVLERENWIDVQPDFDDSHYTHGFAHPDGKFHFRPNWESVRLDSRMPALGRVNELPELPDHWDGIESANDRHPFKLATSPARAFLNSTFNETSSSLRREGRPTLLVHPADLAALHISEGEKVRIGNKRGAVLIHVRAFEGLRRGVVIAESIWPNDAFEDGQGINTLTGSDQPAPCGGAPYHDSSIWIRRIDSMNGC